MVLTNVKLTGVQETLLMALHCRSEDAKQDKAILGDK
jgi:hypothetical protein